MIQFQHLSRRIFNVPVAIVPEKAEEILTVLSGRFGASELYVDGRNVPLQAKVGSDVLAEEKEVGYQIEQGIAIIQVCGTLVHKNGYLSPMSGLCGYDGLRHNFNAALADPNVKGIAFDIDSGGGEVSGCFDLADTIFGARGKKPMMAILSEMAYSAAYALASACDIVTVPKTGGTGSIGVLAMHVDMSQKLEREGVKVTMIHYGARKVDGNEVTPLSKEGLKKMQQMVDVTGEMFVDLVARNRELTKKKIREMEAACFYGKDEVEAGLADGINSPDEAFSELLKLIS